MIVQCQQCRKLIAPGMTWVHAEDHERGRIFPKPRIHKTPVGNYSCRIGKGAIGVGATVEEAYEAWRTRLDY